MRDEFLKYYPQIFTETVKQKLLKSQNEDILCTGNLLLNGASFFVTGKKVRKI